MSNRAKRYLSRKVRGQLTPLAQRRATNRRKKDGTAQGKARVAYSRRVNAAMRLAGVY
jgi:hypothetical protein